jgi:hypothetical protein
MKKLVIPLLAIVTILMLSCAPVVAPVIPTPTYVQPAPTDPAPVHGLAVVTGVEIQVTRNSPLQVNAIVRGQLPDAGCTSIAGIQQARLNNTFEVTLTTIADPLAVCALLLTPFEKSISLDVQGRMECILSKPTGLLDREKIRCPISPPRY